MNPFLDSLSKSLVGTGPSGPIYRAATKAGKAALKEAPKHKSLKGMTDFDKEYASDARFGYRALRRLKRTGVYDEGKGGVQFRVMRGQPEIKNRTLLSSTGAGPEGFSTHFPVKGKSQRQVHHFVAINPKAGSTAERADIMRHEIEHTRVRKPMSRSYRMNKTPEKMWGEEARADGAMSGSFRSGYETAAHYGGTAGKMPDSDRGRRRYLAIRRKISAAKGTKGSQPIVSKGLPPYGRVPGIGRVKVNGLHSKDLFDVTDSKDTRRLIPRHRLMFVKSKKISPPNGGMGAAQMLPKRKPRKVLKPKYTQPALFDIKGRVNPSAKPE